MIISRRGHSQLQVLITSSKVTSSFVTVTSNAYRAKFVDSHPPPGALVVAIECQVDGIAADVVVDHHRPGDPGFAKPAAEFWLGSSVGQLFELLRAKGLIQRQPSITEVSAAAGDHCPGGAYRGECPGVDPEALMQWRVATQATFRKSAVEEVMAEVEAGRKLIQTRLKAGEAIPHFAETVPSLPEASLRECVAVSYEMDDKQSGRRKVGLLNASKEVCEQWMREAPVRLGLVDVYGSPDRGYAGGYKA